MKSNVKVVVTLFLITLISGLALGGVYQITKDPIDRANNAAKYAAYEELVPGASEYNNDEEAVAAFVAAQGDDAAASIDDFVACVDANGNVLGYVVTATAFKGYGGSIQMTVGYAYNDAGELANTGISFLSISETAGLGMKATEPEFKNQYVGKLASDQLTVTKSGNAGQTEINAMSGATITSNAVTDAVNAANSFVESYTAQNA